MGFIKFRVAVLVLSLLGSSVSMAAVERFIQSEVELKNCFLTVCKVNRSGDYGAIYETSPADDVIFCNENYNRAGVFHREVALAPDALNAEDMFVRKYDVDQNQNYSNLVKGPIFCIDNREAQESYLTPSSPIVQIADVNKSEAIVDNQDGTFTIVNPYFQVSGGEIYYFSANYTNANLCPLYGFARQVKPNVNKIVPSGSNLRRYDSYGTLLKVYDQSLATNYLDDIVAEMVCSNGDQ